MAVGDSASGLADWGVGLKRGTAGCVTIRDVTVTSVTVHHHKIPNGEVYRLSFNYHGNHHGLENPQDTSSKSHYAFAACNVCLLCSEENMVEGGRDRSCPQGIFPPSKRTKSEVWVYFGYYKNAQGRLVEDGSPICKKKVVVRGGNTSNLFTHLCDHHPQLFSKCKVS